MSKSTRFSILGTHKELTEIEDGIYANLVKAQQFKDDSEEEKPKTNKYERQMSEQSNFNRNTL